MINQNKRIGITLRVEKIKEYNEKRDSISHDWVKFLEKSNVLPIFIPNTLKKTKKFLEEMKMDGLIMSGGDNKGDDLERDNTEKEIIEFALEREMPLLGVCRGMQVMNNFFGGTQTFVNNSKHVGKHHQIRLIESNSQKYFHTEKIMVNSYHNNIINKNSLGKDLQIFAISETDDTVEGFFHKKVPMIGVMWHPEREQNLVNESILMKIFYDKLFWGV